VRRIRKKERGKRKEEGGRRKMEREDVYCST
jgi:hypothetical protein